MVSAHYSPFYNKKWLFLCLVLTMATVLFFFDPEKTTWLPKCPFYLLTGYKCPSCGIQRAIYQLLHGNFYKAFRYNAFLVISVPYATLLAIVTWFDSKNKLIHLKRICYNHLTVYIYTTMMIVWWIVRNIVPSL